MRRKCFVVFSYYFFFYFCLQNGRDHFYISKERMQFKRDTKLIFLGDGSLVHTQIFTNIFYKWNSIHKSTKSREKKIWIERNREIKAATERVRKKMKKNKDRSESRILSERNYLFSIFSASRSSLFSLLSIAGRRINATKNHFCIR